MSKIFIGTLPEDIIEDEIRDLFGKFGTIKFLSLKNPPRPPPFAFLEFVDESSATQAVQEMNDTNLRGQNIRVEICRPSNRDRDRQLSNYSNRRYGSQYRVEISNLATRVSWQDLKDLFRNVAEVVHSEVDGKGRGIVSFRSPKDMEYAIQQLDGETVEGQRITVREEYQQERRGNYRNNRSRSNDNGRRRKRSSSYRRERGYDRDRRDSRSRPRDRDHSSRRHSTRHRSHSNDRDYKRKRSNSRHRSRSGSHSPRSSKKDLHNRDQPVESENGKHTERRSRSPRHSPTESHSRSNSNSKIEKE